MTEAPEKAPERAPEKIPDIVFEVSWEACNKVGGIYTVLMSKAELMTGHYPGYYLIGPYIEKSIPFTFIEKRPPKEFTPTFEALAKEGIVCHYGTWHIKGEPTVILLDTAGFAAQKNDLKKKYWEAYQVDSLFAHWDFEEPLIWATAAGKLIEQVALAQPGKKILGHFHEWLAGFGLLYLNMQKAPVATVFTTHATMLGRSIAGSGEDLYSMLDTINPDEEARRRGVHDKHSAEKAAARAADVFTTVSEITGLEAEKFHGRKPDILVLNGLDIAQFPDIERTSVMHQHNRDDIRNFLKYYFFPHYSFDMEQTLLFFILGRYEFRNKGIDIFIKALSLLNKKLKATKSQKTIIVFFWIPRDVLGTKAVLYENKSNFDEIEEYVEENITKIKGRIVRNIIRVRDSEWKEQALARDLFDKPFVENVQKLTYRFLKKTPVPLVTHDISNEEEDAIIKAFRNANLTNKKDDRVKVIFYPVYLTGADGLINMSYYDCIMGCHLGVFPSYYEPWGYTPLESAALGVPALTTDLSGFGKFLLDNKKGKKGIFVLNRFGRPEEEVVEEFTHILLNYVKLHQDERVTEKVTAKETASLADWKKLIVNYFEAHKLALQKHGW